MILLYWDIGRAILAKQQVQGWGARVIDRLSHDLKTAFPAMSGFSPCNLKYMRLFASAWPDRMVVQRTVAQLPWRSNLALLEKLDVPEQRLWYAEKAIQQGLSKDMLVVQIESRWHERQGSATHNFAVALPPTDSDMAAQVFKDPYLFDFLGTAPLRREAELEQKLVDHIQPSAPCPKDSSPACPAWKTSSPSCKLILAQGPTMPIDRFDARVRHPLAQIADEVAALAARVGGHLVKMGVIWR